MTEKYLCYCETNVKQIESSLKGAVSAKAQVEEELAKAKTDRADAKAAIEDATAQREKEAKAFAAEAAEDKANIAACTKAVAAIEKGMRAGFRRDRRHPEAAARVHGEGVRGVHGRGKYGDRRVRVAVAAKKKEIAAATTAIEVKTEKNGEL